MQSPSAAWFHADDEKMRQRIATRLGSYAMDARHHWEMGATIGDWHALKFSVWQFQSHGWVQRGTENGYHWVLVTDIYETATATIGCLQHKKWAPLGFVSVGR